MGATLLRVAAIIGARIAVVAVGLVRTGTDTRPALVSQRARIAIVAGQTFVIGNQRAASIIGSTGSGQTTSVGSGWRPRATDHRCFVGCALEREAGVVTIESAGAGIPIFQRYAVSITLALAGDRSSDTASAAALVGDGAGVSIVTVCRVVKVEAAPGTITFVIGARIIVITDHR